MRNDMSRTDPEIRKLWRRDLPEITKHLLRLDSEVRRLRFGTATNDSFIHTYADSLLGGESVVFGAFPGGHLRAIGELRGLRQFWPSNAEIALSVEPDWQGRGIGSMLFSRLVMAAQNRGVKSLHVLFLHENERMRRIASRHKLSFEVCGREVDASFDPPWPTSLSIAHEIVDDTNAFARQVFTLAK